MTDALTNSQTFSDATVPVEDLAEWLCITPRRVQQLEKKGIVMKDGHGAYRLRDSVQGYIREMNAKADGKNSEYHKERTKKMKIDRMKHEAEYLVRMGKLVNADELQREIERVNAEERQAILNMPKNLAQRLEGLSTTEMEIELNEWAYKHLTSVSALAVSETPGPESIPGQDAAAEAHGEPVGGRKAEAGR